MNRQNVAEWCHEFNAGRTDVNYEQRTDRPSLMMISFKKLRKTFVLVGV
jgi:hypothetical protein